MGQYYNPTSLDRKEWLYSHDCKSTYKRDDGTKYTVGQGLKLMEHSWVGNKFMDAILNLLIPGGAWHKTRIVWAGDYADEGLFLDEQYKDINVYTWVEKEGTKIKPSSKNIQGGRRWLLNHTKNEAVLIPKPSKDTWQPHPLSLLTCSGNGRGGGDYRLANGFTGTWAGDVISLEAEKPVDFTEITPNFIED